MRLTTSPRKKAFVTETATTKTQTQTYSGPRDDSSQEIGGMTIPNESPFGEVRDMMGSLLRPNTKLRLGAWNVRTMYETSKSAQVANEMRRYHLDILGVSECRWTGAGRQIMCDGSTILYSGHEKNHINGVALIIDKEKVNTLMDWEPISDRMLRARFNSKHCKLTILQCYAPTNEAEDEVKDVWYEHLSQVISKVPRHDMLLIIGDLNAKVGNDNTNYGRAMGKHGCGVMNNNGERLADFCLNNNLVIGGTIFPHKNIHKLTWRSPDDRSVNQIDHIITNGKWRRSLTDVRAFRGADVFSDHHLITATVKLKLRKMKKQSEQRKQLDSTKLKCPSLKQQFVLEIRNRFQALADTTEDDTSVNTKWDVIKNTYVDAAIKILGYKKKNNKKWITPGTWQKIEERKQLKAKLLNTKSLRLQEQVKKAYTSKDKEVKRSARKDKRSFVEGLALEAEQAAARGELGTVYKITKQLCGRNNSQSAPIRCKNGTVITNEQEQATRWVQHFQEVLNCPKPNTTANPQPAIDALNIDISPITTSEIKDALKAMKSGKAAGIDSIEAEMLKADPDTATSVLVDLFKTIWESDTIPSDWSKGLIVKLPKKGNLQICDNWRGITLLSIPSKIFCRVLLQRIEPAINNKLREEQAGFRKGRGCIDQIFALRNIIEQCIEWNVPLYMNFIDFRKAFDSVHRETLWNILKSYGIPDKIITMISLFYSHFECSVIINSKTLSEWFPVESGVRQGCILSPILFLVVLDWIMRKTTSDMRRGIQWTPFSHLEDLDFADDLVALSSKRDHLQEKTDRLSNYAAQTGLNINIKKTQVMCINTTNPTPTPININGVPLDFVEDFVYLGSLISKDNGAKKDIQARLSKARGAFARLQPIWKSQQYQLRTKIQLYNSCVKSVLTYGSECWRVVKGDMSKISAFHNGCLRKICRIFWPSKLSNEELHAKTGCQDLVLQIKLRRLRWLGHVLRMSRDRVPRAVLGWTPPGKRRPGRPRNTWRRTVERELKEMKITWSEAQRLAQDRREWRNVVGASFLTWEEED